MAPAPSGGTRPCCPARLRAFVAYARSKFACLPLDAFADIFAAAHTSSSFVAEAVEPKSLGKENDAQRQVVRVTE